MAVLVIILAPALLTYNERSRAERDNSAMDEVVNAVQLALADAQIYDEVVRFSTVDNISCYVDTDSEANYNRIVTKSNPDGVDQYTFDSTSRQLDETPYYAAGNMRGVTLTFAPDKGSNGSTFDFKQGVVNQYVQIKGNHRVGALQGLYGRINSSVGESLEIKSPTYRNSEYTIFIRLGSTGGNDESKQNSIQAYGQWSGTNLPAEVSYKLVSDRSIGDPGNQIVEIDDSKWNSTNGTKITVKPGDLNGGGSFTPGTPTGNKDFYTAEDFAEDEKGIYAYLINGNTLVLRNSPRQDMSDVTKEYGMLNANHQGKWGNEKSQIEYIDIETPILPKNCSYYFHSFINLLEVKNPQNICLDECSSIAEMFRNCQKLKSLDLSTWNVSNVTAINHMFFDCRALSSLDLDNWNPKNSTRMESMFYNCGELVTLDLSDWDVSKVTKLSHVFYNCAKLTKLDISNWVTQKVHSMESMFYNCKSLTNVDVSSFNTSNVTNMTYMFYNCNSLAELDVSHWNVENVTNMNSMFRGCNNLITIDVSNWNVLNVANFGDVFRDCFNLKSLDVKKWNTANVTRMNSMFYGCLNLTELDVSNWNTANVTYMDYMFSDCEKIVPIGVENWDTSNVINMRAMFELCESIKELDLSGWDTHSVTNMHGMFYGCKIEILDASTWDTSNVTTMSHMFCHDGTLKELYANNWDTSNVLAFNLMMNYCTNLTTFETGVWHIHPDADTSGMFNFMPNESKPTLVYD